MSISSVTSSTVSQLQKSLTPEAVEPRRAGPDHDGDSDDRGGSVSTAKPVVNTSGQTTGLLVNDKA